MKYEHPNFNKKRKIFAVNFNNTFKFSDSLNVFMIIRTWIDKWDMNQNCKQVATTLESVKNSFTVKLNFYISNIIAANKSLLSFYHL